MDIRRATGIHSLINPLYYLALFALPWINFGRVSIFLLMAVAVMTLISGQIKADLSFLKKYSIAWCLVLYYILILLSFIFFPAEPFGRQALEHKSSLLVIPILVYILYSSGDSAWFYGVRGFVTGVAFACVFCLMVATSIYFFTGETGSFFYHRFASPLKLNAIYFSVFILIALGYLVKEIAVPGIRNGIYQAAIILLLICLFLLSSKMMIAAGLPVFLFYLVQSTRRKFIKYMIGGGVLVTLLVLFITQNPLRKRFSEINITGFTKVLSQTDYHDQKFNGLSLRLVLWKLGLETIKENGNILTGFGGERYHEQMNRKIEAYGLYSGNTDLEDNGYKNYNMHNQYIESYMQFGIGGLFLILAAFTFGFYHAFKKGKRILIYILAIFSLVFLTESFIETQAGIVAFTIIICSEWVQPEKKIS
jgi:O-antigen ligase